MKTVEKLIKSEKPNVSKDADVSQSELICIGKVTQGNFPLRLSQITWGGVK